VPLFVLAQAALIEALLAQGRSQDACAAGADGEAAAQAVDALGEGEVLFGVLYGEALDAEVREAWTQAVAENVQAVARAEESVAP
jgi:hypothetical protein